ncbi:unnamed protein product [Linum trigynum]|uniref:Gnk2-homologous domain-containing protein n=1 Tax=Linum trigynum TaxID=586398 RepID=A0AAV2DWX9_9ROSI
MPMKCRMALIALSHVFLLCLVSVTKGGTYYCDGHVDGDKYRKAVKDIVDDMADETPKRPDFAYYEAGGRVSGSSRCGGSPGLTTDQKACHNCLERLQTELTSSACLSSQTASASEDSACSMSFWKI